MKRRTLNPISMLLIGLLMGVISRLLDIYTQNLGNMFSQMSIWILFGVIISIYSDSKKKAMINNFPFCIGMLISYYLVAEISNGVYGFRFIVGWLIFSSFSPVFAYFTWMTKEKGVLPIFISIGIIIITGFISIRFYGGPRIYDILILLYLSYLLFICKINREIK